MGAELVYADERTDRKTGRHDEANSRFSQLCEKRLKSEEITAVLSADCVTFQLIVSKARITR